MQIGAPFNCKNCNAQLAWRDTPVVECEYCHTRILMSGPGGPAQVRTPRAGAGRGLLVVAAIAVVGAIVVIAVVKSGSKQATTPASAPPSVTASATPRAEKPAPQPKPTKPAAVGKAVLKFGEAGTNAGQLTDARALAVTPSGEIVIAEARSGRVQVFDATGAYQRLITLPPSALTKELTVFGAGAGPDGKVVVARVGDLLVLDVAAGKVAQTIRGSYPEVYYHGDVEVVPDGSIHAITDRTGDLNIVHVSPAGKILGQLKKVGARHVAIDGLGTMLITRDDTIDVRDAKGEVVRRFSQGNPARGKLSRPGPIALDGKGHVFVAENHSVLVFDPEGAFIAELEVGSIQDLAVDRAGFLYVLGRDTVTKYELALPATK